MQLKAMYYPKLTSFFVWYRIGLLEFAASAVLRYARPRFGLFAPVAAVLLGLCISVSNGVQKAFTTEYDEFYRKLCRDGNGVDLPDGCFELIRYCELGV